MVTTEIWAHICIKILKAPLCLSIFSPGACLPLSQYDLAESLVWDTAPSNHLWESKKGCRNQAVKGRQASSCIPHHRKDFFFFLWAVALVQTPNASQNTPEVCPEPLSWGTWRFLCRQDSLPSVSSTNRWASENTWKPLSHISSIQRLSWRAVAFSWRSCG